jgi:hypothetical protein
MAVEDVRVSRLVTPNMGESVVPALDPGLGRRPMFDEGQRAIQLQVRRFGARSDRTYNTVGHTPYEERRSQICVRFGRSELIGSLTEVKAGAGVLPKP